MKKPKWSRKKNSPNAVCKTRIIPTAEQKDIFRRWFGTAGRFVFNRTISKIKEGEKIDFNHLRNLIVPKHQISEEEKWMLDTPKDIRAEAVREAVTAYKSAFTNLKQGNIDKFDVGFRSKKKQQTECINIPFSALNVLEDGVCIYKKYINDVIKLKNNKDLTLFQGYSIKLLYHKNINKWFLLIPRLSFRTTENQGGWVSIDPGERSFITAYGEKGNAFKVGYDDMKKKILPVLKRIDRIQSLIDRKKKGVPKRKLRYKIKRLRYKIKCMVNECHHKITKYLCDNYNIIILPHFGGGQMAQKHILSHEVNRRMLSWNHYNFRTLLENKASKYLDCKVYICTEEYTSKTCGSCGNHNNKIGGSEVFRCSQCGIHMDRDLNGARNILLKTLSRG